MRDGIETGTAFDELGVERDKPRHGRRIDPVDVVTSVATSVLVSELRRDGELREGPQGPKGDKGDPGEKGEKGGQR